MSGNYGIRHKPAFGELHTAPRPGRTRAPVEWVAREGAGDYRRPVMMFTGKGVAGDVPGDHRASNGSNGHVLRYIAKRNGLPVGQAYGPAGLVEAGGRAWRQPGGDWAARLAARNIDPAAIAAADAEIDGRKRKRKGGAYDGPLPDGAHAFESEPLGLGRGTDEQAD